MRNHDDHNVTFEEALEDTSRTILKAANLMAATIDLAPPDVDTCFYWNVMDWLRITADKIDPPRHEWPENVVPFIRKIR